MYTRRDVESSTSVLRFAQSHPAKNLHDSVPPTTFQVEAAFVEGQNGKQNALTHYNKQQIDQLNDLIRYCNGFAAVDQSCFFTVAPYSDHNYCSIMFLVVFPVEHVCMYVYSKKPSQQG